MDSNKELIVDFCKKLGIDTLGFTKVRRFTESELFFKNRKTKGLENEFEEKDIEKRINPKVYMEDGKTIISVAFPYVFDADVSTGIHFSKYTWGADYHQVVLKYLNLIAEYILSLGGNAKCFVDNNTLPERYIAFLSGVGFIGKNGTLVTEKYGSFVFLGEIITDLELEESNKLKNKCGACSLCLKACPTGAINEEGCNPNICLSYITQKKHIEDVWFNKFGDRLFGCDTCQMACPYNKHIEFSCLQEFKPLEFMKNVSVEELLYMDNEVFNTKYRRTSCGWRGKSVLQRNILLNINHVDIKRINSPYVIEYYNRLLKLLKL